MSAANALNSDKTPQPAVEPRAPEPSMDDILASIRRIIADDQSRHAALTPSYRRTPAPSPAGASLQADGALLRSPAEPPATVASPPLQRPVPRSATETFGTATLPAGGITPHLNPPPMPVGDLAFDPAVIDAIASAGVAAALQPVDKPWQAVVEPAEVAPSPAEAPVAEPSRPEALAAPPPAQVDEPVPGDLAPVEVPAVATASAPEPEAAAPASAAPRRADPETDTEPLVSSAAGASIETSFNALATSVFLQNTGMIEGMVRDMLKPMLRSWLDDNLPSIVERLVRIEIERVARGGRT